MKLRLIGGALFCAALLANSAAHAACSVSEKKEKVGDAEQTVVLLENERVCVKIMPDSSGTTTCSAADAKTDAFLYSLRDFPYSSTPGLAGKCDYSIVSNGPDRAAVTLRYAKKLDSKDFQQLGLEGNDVDVTVERTVSIAAGSSKVDVDVNVKNTGQGPAPEYMHAIETLIPESEPMPEIGNASWYLPGAGAVEYFDVERASRDMAEANWGHGASYQHRFSAFTPGRAADAPRYEAHGWASVLTSRGAVYLYYDPTAAGFLQYEYYSHPKWALLLAPYSKPAELKPGASRTFHVTLTLDPNDVPGHAQGIVLQQPAIPLSATAGQALPVRLRVSKTIPAGAESDATVAVQIKDAGGAIVFSKSASTKVQALKWADVRLDFEIPPQARNGEYTWEAGVEPLNEAAALGGRFDVTSPVADKAPAPPVTPAIVSSAARIEQLKKGGEWWFHSDTGTIHLELSYDEPANTLKLKRSIVTHESEANAELVFSADVSPRLVSFIQERTGRKSAAKGTVDGETLSGVDCDGDAYRFPYHGELLPDCATTFAAMAMDWNAARRFKLTLIDTASQDILPPQSIYPHSEKKIIGGAAVTCTVVRIGDYFYSVDGNGHLMELSHATYPERWRLIDAPKIAPHAAPEPAGVDEAVANAMVAKMLKNPPASGQLIQSATAHAAGLGLLAGDIVTKYDGTATDSFVKLRAALATARNSHKKSVELEFLRGNELKTLTIPTGQIGISTVSLVKGVETNLDDAMFGGMGFGPGPRPAPTKYEKLAREKCGSQLTWLSDYAAALDAAKAQHKVVLWWATPIHGSSIYKLDVFTDFLNVGLFTDPEIVAFVKGHFIPFNAPLTKKQMDDFHLDFLTAPAFLFVAGDGKLIHYVDGLTTIQREFFLRTFETVVRSTGEKLDFQHLIDTGPLQHFMGAQELERNHQAADAIGLFQSIDLKTPEGAALADAIETEIRWIHLRSGHPERVVELFKNSDAAKDDRPRAIERLYLRGAALLLLNKDDDARSIWKLAADKDATDPWAWRAAAELENIGPLSRGIESPYWLPDNVMPKTPTLATLPHTTRPFLADANVENAERVGVEYLLQHQSADGGWNDTNYDFGGIHAMPNVRTAVTAICAEALLAHRELDPARVDTALHRAFGYLTDRSHISWDDKNEIIWAHIYRLNFFAAWLRTCPPELKPKLLQEMQTISTTLTSEHLSKTGFFRHEYENDFVTVSVLLSLKLAKDAGVPVDDRALARSLDALETLRSPRGTYPYDAHPDTGPEAWKGSAGRTINCEAALLAWGRSSAERLRVAIEKYIQFNFVQERVRKETFHSDAYRIGGFFYWYNQHVLSQVTALTDPETAQKAAKFMREMVLATREADGTWVDSIELGKTYATGMALLVLDAAKRFGKL